MPRLSLTLQTSYAATHPKLRVADPQPNAHRNPAKAAQQSCGATRSIITGETWSNIAAAAKRLTSIPAMPTVLLLLRVEVTQVKGSSLPKRTRIANLSLNTISPVANPCCNATLKIGVVLSLGMGDATALQSKQEIG